MILHRCKRDSTSTVDIGVFGATGSGRSVFSLAAIVAALPSYSGGPHWVGFEDCISLFEVADGWNELRVGRFPPADSAVSMILRCTFYLNRGGWEPSRFVFHMTYCPTRMFWDPEYELYEEQELILDDFSRCDSLIYLFDPLREQWNELDPEGSNFGVFQGMTEQLSSREAASGTSRPSRPLAVCVTKFDDSEVFSPACAAGWVSLDQSGSPVAKDSQGFFKSRAGEQLVDAVRAYSHHSPVNYFVTSAMGFKTPDHGAGCLADLANVHGQLPVSGVIDPSNVLEPLIWLEQQVRRQRKEGRKSR